MKSLLSFLCVLFLSFPVLALSDPDPELFEILGDYAIVMEDRNGQILYAKQPDVKMPTSSMSKVMTMYLVFEALEKGALRMDQEVLVSKKAWEAEGSRMFLPHAERVSVEQLIQGVVVQSGNDASIALAEALAGSEDGFASLMNAKAQKLGMTNSHFVNATGLPDPDHYSTARDLAILTRALIHDFPQYYHYYSQKEFTFNNIRQSNRNPLLYEDTSVDGVKTGHTEDAGYGLISSALRDGRRLIAVINGVKTKKLRGSESARLLDLGYHGFENNHVVMKGKEHSLARVWLGQDETVPVVPAEDVFLTLAKKVHNEINVKTLVADETEAPIAKGQVIGRLRVTAPGMEPVEVDLLASKDVKKLGAIKAVVAKLKRMIEEML